MSPNQLQRLLKYSKGLEEENYKLGERLERADQLNTGTGVATLSPSSPLQTMRVSHIHMIFMINF